MLRMALVLGLLSALGPFTIDMYLPAMDGIAGSMNASIQAVQGTLTVFFAAFGLSQLVYGPLADTFGRRWPMALGLVLFAIASVGAAMADSVGELMVWRALQAIGGAGAAVMPRAIVRDLYTGVKATKLVSLVMLVTAVSPMLAPLAGALVLKVAEWPTIFYCLAALGLAALVLGVVSMPETLPKEKRQRASLSALLEGYKSLLKDPVFIGLTFVGAFGLASFFVYISTAAFVYTGPYGLTEVQFSLLIAVNSIGFFGTSQLTAPLGRRIGMVKMLRLALAALGVTSVIFLGLSFAGFNPLWFVVAGMFMCNFWLGFVQAPAAVLALEKHGKHAGMGASLSGTLQTLTGSVMIAVTGPFFTASPFSMVASSVICCIVAVVISFFILPRVAEVKS